MILITGTTGLLGNSVVREFIARGEPVRAFCRPSSNLRALADLPVQLYQGELTSLESMAKAIEGCSTVVHCAAHIHLGWNRLEESRAINAAGTRTVAEVCRASGCRMIHVSTVDALPVAPNPDHPVTESCTGLPNVPCSYVISKQEAERVVLEFLADGLDAVIINPGFLLGPYDWKPSSGRMMLQLRQAPIVIAPGGGASACDARDVAHAIANCVQLGRCGQRFIVAGTNITYQQLWTEMLRTMGSRKRVHCFPRAVAASGPIIDAINLLRGRRDATPNGAEIAMGGLYHYYDSSKAQRELNYQTRPLSETITDAWDWLSHNHLRT